MPGERKVLLLADESPFIRERAPLARELDNYLEALGSSGWQAAVATVRARWDWHRELESRGIPACSLTTTRYSGLPIAARRFAQVVGRESPDIVHAFGPFCALISGASRFLAPGPTRIYDRSHVSGRPRLTYASRIAARLNDHTMARSGAVRDAALLLDRTPPAKVSVALDGARAPREVGDAELARLRHDRGIKPGSAVVGIVARLRPEKGHLTLLEAMRSLGSRIPRPLHLVVVGAGPFERAIRNAIGADEPFIPHLVGYQDDVAPWYALSDVVAIPSYQDASPKAAAEALAAARPVVASNVGGLPEQIVDGVTGLLVPPGDPGALAQAILTVLTDRALASRLGVAGRVHYRSHLTLEQRSVRWMRCYDEVMNPHPRQKRDHR